MVCESTVQRGVNKGKPATGLFAGYQRHRKAGEEPCVACADFWRGDAGGLRTRTYRYESRAKTLRVCDGCGESYLTGASSLYRWCSSRCRPRSAVAAALRQRVLDRDGLECRLCGGLMDPADLEMVESASGVRTARIGPAYPTVDHIVPQSLGGSDDLSNLRAAHKSCNERRGTARGEQLAWAV